MTIKALSAALALLCFTSPVLAQEAEGDRRGPPDFVALGVGYSNDYVGAEDIRIIPFGAFRFSTPIADIQSSGLSVFADVLAPAQRDNSVRFQLGPQVNYRFGRRREDIEGLPVEALGRIDDAVEVGAIAGVEIDTGNRGGSINLRAEALRDVSDVYDGWTYGLEATFNLPTPREWRANIVVNTQYGGDRFHDRYFSITPAQSVVSGLPAYRADEGFYQAAVGTNLRRPLSRRVFVAGQFVYARLIDDVADSPVVRSRGGSPDQFRGGLTVGLTF